MKWFIEYFSCCHALELVKIFCVVWSGSFVVLKAGIRTATDCKFKANKKASMGVCKRIKVPDHLPIPNPIKIKLKERSGSLV